MAKRYWSSTRDILDDLHAAFTRCGDERAMEPLERVKAEVSIAKTALAILRLDLENAWRRKGEELPTTMLGDGRESGT